MKLTGTREQLVEQLRMHLPEDIPIVDYLPDQFAQPAVLVAWGTPWLQPATLRGGWRARLDIYLVGSRFQPGGTWAVLEGLAEGVVAALEASREFTHEQVSGPASWEISGVTYLAARWTVTAEIEE